MKKFLSLPLTVLLTSLLLAACSAPVAPAAEASAAAPAADRGLYPVTSRLADGSYYQSTWFEQGPYGSRIVHTLYGAWIDIRVQNLAYAKEVGLVYTTDGWLTNAKAAASYELPLDNGTNVGASTSRASIRAPPKPSNTPSTPS